MSHALIIDDNMAISRGIEERLTQLGFHSFDHVWTEAQALVAAELRPPDLVVVGDSIATGSALDAARNITLTHHVPILAVTADSGQLHRELSGGGTCDGPYSLAELELAVGAARIGTHE